MDDMIKVMDARDTKRRHWLTAPLPRRYPGGLPVRSIGYFREKSGPVRRRFPRRFYSVILAGDGEYRRDGRSWPVKAPCAFTHGVGTYVEYAPEGQWEELYLTYAAPQERVLRERNLVPPGKPIWYAHNPRTIRGHVSDLLAALEDVYAPGRADQVDRICERLIMDSLISAAAPPADENSSAIAAARAYVESRFREEIDFAELAAAHGFSVPGFRRHWRAAVGAPPTKFLNVLRINEACRLLVETELDVNQVARRVGYNDPLYFSRKFRQVVGETASAYRKGHR